ncbi:MAG TPA: anthrone oxygenase family protein, partial [Candidatus Limnocylindrales bacterium]|nr:anthrone oxygenase family protein [Candidatus Limnocylindrales bacterium]
LSMITGVILLFVGDPTSTQVVLTIIGIAGSIGIAATSLGVNMRINREMATWDATNPPPEFHPRITRWLGVHRIRTLSGTIAFVCYLVAALA